MSLKIFRPSRKIVRVRLKEDFSIPGQEVEEVEEIDPEEKERLEREQAEREAFERRIAAEVDARIQDALAKQYEELTGRFLREKKEGYEQGVEEGILRGESTAVERLTPIKKNLISIAEAMNDHRRKILIEAEGSIVKLVYQVTKRIIGKEIKENPEIIGTVVRDALRYVADETSLVLRINPKDKEVIEGQINELATHSGELKDIQIRPDDKITQGGCIIETETGMIDARLESKLDTLASLFKME